MTCPKFTWPSVISYRVILPRRYDYEVARRFFDLMQPTEEEREQYRNAIDGS